MVHAELVCAQSKYFTGAISGQFAEGRTKCLKLKEENIVTFKLFMDWLYQQNLARFPVDDWLSLAQRLGAHNEPALEEPEASDTEEEEENNEDDDASKDSNDGTEVNHSSSNESSDDDSDDGEASSTTASESEGSSQPDDADSSDVLEEAKRIHFQLIELYIFADRRHVRHLRNTIMTKLITLRLNCWPLLSSSYGNIHHAYEWLQPTSKLCEYIAEEATYCWNYEERGKQFMNSLEKLPHAFLAEVVKSAFQFRLNKAELWKAWIDADICHYHEHEEGEEEKCKTAHQHLQKRAEGKAFCVPVASSDLVWV